MAKTHLSLPAESDAAAGAGDSRAPVNGYLEGPFAPVKQEMTIYDLAASLPTARSGARGSTRSGSGWFAVTGPARARSATWTRPGHASSIT